MHHISGGNTCQYNTPKQNWLLWFIVFDAKALLYHHMLAINTIVKNNRRYNCVYVWNQLLKQWWDLQETLLDENLTALLPKVSFRSVAHGNDVS